MSAPVAFSPGFLVAPDAALLTCRRVTEVQRQLANGCSSIQPSSSLTLPSERPKLRRPPQSNCPAYTVPRPASRESGLGHKCTQSGISLTTPPELAPGLHCLPPMLHMTSQNPMLSCSKGSRGLSVLARESGIFTTTSISPSPSWRQRPTRYAIHAGRNLPDKELRYLRTVIVTAAIHRGFGSQLRLAANRFP